MITNGAYVRIWKEELVAYFKVSSKELPTGTEKNYRNLSQCSQHPNKDLNWILAKFEYRILQAYQPLQ
jgi:hypothetical protein